MKDGIQALPGRGKAGPDNALYVRRRQGDHKIGPTTGQCIKVKSQISQSELNPKAKGAPGPAPELLGKPSPEDQAFLDATVKPLPLGMTREEWEDRKRTQLDPGKPRKVSKRHYHGPRIGGGSSRRKPRVVREVIIRK